MARFDVTHVGSAVGLPRHHGVRCTAAGLRAYVNTDKPLHWVDHFKSKRPDRRSFAARKLALMPTAKVVHAITLKGAVRSNSDVRDGIRVRL